MLQSLRRIVKVAVGTVRRVLPWTVLAGAVGFAGYMVLGVLPSDAPGLIAQASLATVYARIIVQLGAICAGVFALTAVPRTSGAMDSAMRRRWRSLREIGVLSIAAGTAGMFGGLIGISIGRTGAGLAFTAICGALSAWGTWSLTRTRTGPSMPPALGAAASADEWIARRAVQSARPAVNIARQNTPH